MQGVSARQRGLMHAFLATAIVLPTVAVSVIPEEGLVSFWDFQETSGPFTAKLGSGKYTLEETTWDNDTRTWSSGNTVARVRDVPPGAPFGPQSASLTQEQMLNIHETQKMAPLLNIHGDNATLSVVAWVKPGEMEHKADFGHVVGIWSEPIDARTYVLFAPGSSRGGWNHLDAEVSRTGLTMQPACRWSTSYARRGEHHYTGVAHARDDIRRQKHTRFCERDARLPPPRTAFTLSETFATKLGRIQHLSAHGQTARSLGHGARAATRRQHYRLYYRWAA